MKGWFISDYKGSEIEKKFLSLNSPNVELVHLESIELVIDSNHPDSMLVSGKWVKKPDFAICTIVNPLHGDMEYMEYIYRVLDHLESMDVYCFPKPEVMRKTGDKFRTAQLLTKAGVPTPLTALLTKNSNPQRVVEQVGLPIVVKIPDGSKGQGIFLVHNQSELEELMQEHLKSIKDVLLAQEFIKESKGKDIRITLAMDDLIFSILRDNTKNDDFRSNVALGGIATIIEPTEQMMDIALRASRALDADLCGVDLLFTDKGFVVGEVNSFPGVSYTDSYKGENLARRYVRMLIELISHRVKERNEGRRE